MKPEYEKKPRSRRGLVWLFPLAVILGVAIYALVNIVMITNERAEAKQEYDGLLDSYGPQVTDNVNAPEDEKGVDHAALAAINQDYAGWLEISCTDISYPVVQGSDNDRYLATTFEGRYNPAGTLFVDVNCRAGFLSQNVIVYGHNMKNGTLFGGLVEYLDAEYLAAHSELTISLPHGQDQTWSIFAARRTDIHDIAYRLHFASDDDFAAFAAKLGAPDGAEQIMVLSTCTNSDNDDERLLVFAALEK